MESRLVRGHAERDRGDARLEVQLASGHGRAVGQHAERGPARDGGAQPNQQVDRLADASARRRIERVDQHLGGRLVGRRDGVEPDATGGRGGDRILGLTRCVVAVGEQHDPLLRAGREDRGRQPHRRPDVGRTGHRGRRGLGQLVELRWQAIDERVGPEDHDAGRVALGHLADRRPGPVHQVLSGCVEHRGRCVEQEDDAQPIRGQREAHPGQRQDEARRQHDPDGERRDPPSAWQGPRRRQPTDDHDGSDRHGQPEPDRVGEVQGQAHRARPPSGCGRRPNARARVRRVGRW